MNFKILFLITFLFLFPPIHLFAQDLKIEEKVDHIKETKIKKIAVLETINTSQYAAEVQHLTKELVQGFKRQVDTKKYEVLDQNDVNLQLSKTQQQVCIQNCEVQIGRQLGIDLMISTFFKITADQKYELNFKVYDTVAASLVFVKTINASNFLELEKEILMNLGDLYKDLSENVGKNFVIKIIANEIDQALGLSFLMGLGIGIDYALYGLQLGFQYQTSDFNLRLSLAVAPWTSIFSTSAFHIASVKFFPNGPKKHHFGMGISLPVGYSDADYFVDISGLYILDIGDFNGFQLTAGLGVLSFLFPTISAGLTYVF